MSVIDTQLFFDNLKRRLEWLDNHPAHDNEAIRHDLLIYPIFTNPLILDWKAEDILSQQKIKVPKDLSESYIFRNAIPKNRKPDLLLYPNEIRKAIGVVEEKKKQINISKLNDQRFQLTEYQLLFECVWGVLTDGEKWIVKRNIETHFEFESLEELQKNLVDLKRAIGKKAVIYRQNAFGSTDIVFIRYFPREAKEAYSESDEIEEEIANSIKANLWDKANYLISYSNQLYEDLGWMDVSDWNFHDVLNAAREAESEYYRMLEEITRL